MNADVNGLCEAVCRAWSPGSQSDCRRALYIRFRCRLGPDHCHWTSLASSAQSSTCTPMHVGGHRLLQQVARTVEYVMSSAFINCSTVLTCLKNWLIQTMGRNSFRTSSHLLWRRLAFDIVDQRYTHRRATNGTVQQSDEALDWQTGGVSSQLSVIHSMQRHTALQGDTSVNHVVISAADSFNSAAAVGNDVIDVVIVTVVPSAIDVQ